MTHTFKTVAGALILLLLGAGHSLAGESAALQTCASCHDLKGPAPVIAEKARARKGPDLFYAGIKYREEWLAKWLQNPIRIRPAGYKYWEHIKPQAAGPDQVDSATLEPHVKLSADEAKAAASELMKLKANEGAVKKTALTPDEIDGFMAEMNFDKFSGCLACHQIEPGYGGVTGPEVYTVGERLQPDFVYSYLKSPQAFDPKGWMPDKQLGENNLQTLSKFMIGLVKEAK
ncbi:MAG: c-type cytochrome [Nitrospinae bacterium]|nr:c-type cytochrome [Nitrospinota bacterium]